MRVVDKIRCNKISFYYSFFLLFTVAKVWGLDASNKEYYFFAFVGSIFWCLAILGSKYTGKELIFCGVLMLISGMSLVFSGKIGAVLPAMVIVAFKDVKVDKLIPIMFKVWGIVFFIKELLVIVGIVPNELWEKNTELSYGSKVYQMGYNHANTFGIVVSILVFLVVYIYWEHLKWWYGVIPFVVAVGVYRIARCYTAAGLLILLGVFIIIYTVIFNDTKINRNFDTLRNIINIVIIVGCFLPLVTTIVVQLIYHNVPSLDRWLKTYTGNRAFVTNYMLENYPITIFGQEFDGRFYYEMVDNAYIFVLLKLGAALFAIFLILSIMCIVKCIRKSDTRALFFIMMFAGYGFMEQFIINPFMNFSILFIADMIWNNNIEIMGQSDKKERT